MYRRSHTVKVKKEPPDMMQKIQEAQGSSDTNGINAINGINATNATKITKANEPSNSVNSVNPVSIDSSDHLDWQETRNRVDSLRASVRRHAIEQITVSTVPMPEETPDSNSMNSFSSLTSRRSSLPSLSSLLPPMAISVHDFDALQRAALPTQQQIATNNFIRNAVMGLSILAAGIGSMHEIPSTLSTSKITNSSDKYALTNTQEILPMANISGIEKSQFKLKNTEFVLSHDLSMVPSKDVRKSLSYTNVSFKGQDHQTLDVPSRLLLSKWASDSKKLGDVGLNWKVLYGFIHAESTWVPQEGMGKNGMKSHGLAQFEDATARGYGLKNAYDPLDSVSAAAALIKDAAYWTKNRLVKLSDKDSNAAQQAQSLREGVSVYYNTGWKTRHAWAPSASSKLPDATRTHIVNVKAGDLIADRLVADIKAGKLVSTPSVSMQKDAVTRAEEMISQLRMAKRQTNSAANTVNTINAAANTSKESKSESLSSPVKIQKPSDAEQISRANEARAMLSKIMAAQANRKIKPA